MTSSQPFHRNRLLAALSVEDFNLIAAKLVRVDLSLDAVLIEAHHRIEHVYFPEKGIVSMVADTARGRIEVGLAGRESMVGVPIILGADRSPHTYLVQATGHASRITVQDFEGVIQARPSILRPFGLYVQALLAQTAQTAYANASFGLEARLARWILMTQDRTESENLVLTHEFLAIMLGVQRTSVTSAIHILEGSSAIRATRGRVTVHDRKTLIQFAEDSYGVAEKEYDRLFAKA